jgi:predicted RNA-binding protein YlqC (UPF0109 family)
VEALVQYLVRPLVRHPGAVSVNVVEGTASVLLELRVHPDDVAAVRGDKGQTLNAMQQVLAVAGGARKAVLDLIDGDSSSSEEE